MPIDFTSLTYYNDPIVAALPAVIKGPGGPACPATDGLADVRAPCLSSEWGPQRLVQKKRERQDGCEVIGFVAALTLAPYATTIPSQTPRTMAIC